uniref:AlNc14C116G6531 protein n=1 Tax=Albugo laibachii Nc14 TaxID=890382 RepID=F0W085_9STRA|nr:AlNc14C3G527 [Albugo laibachii Nc14]CCA21241.1 AlNc14C116G6531 [Albugo laibachii Nc14]|eukprot:CCA21241.1 AlNc14C116G6531 [Albugo laibachii Nc14]
MSFTIDLIDSELPECDQKRHCVESQLLRGVNPARFGIGNQLCAKYHNRLNRVSFVSNSVMYTACCYIWRIPNNSLVLVPSTMGFMPNTKSKLSSLETSWNSLQTGLCEPTRFL